ncbi:MAG: hypothetical protein HC899_38120 [Leptolyngbyaceae cyanobacterium SM1_4_3]|nr:hypothetical protein [Leptolyngbyaceae cyanobacterium SM1_4_3]
MSNKFLRLLTSGFAIVGTAIGFSIFNALSPIELLNPLHFGQFSHHQALAQDGAVAYTNAVQSVVLIETERGNGSGVIVKI